MRYREIGTATDRQTFGKRQRESERDRKIEIGIDTDRERNRYIQSHRAIERYTDRHSKTETEI